MVGITRSKVFFNGLINLMKTSSIYHQQKPFWSYVAQLNAIKLGPHPDPINIVLSWMVRVDFPACVILEILSVSRTLYFFVFWMTKNDAYLAGGLENEFYDFPYIGNVIIPTDELIFFRGVGIVLVNSL